MQRCTDGRQLVHRAIAKVLAIDRHGRKHERERTRGQDVRESNIRGTPDTVRASPRPLRTIALVEGDRVARYVTRCGNAQGVQVPRSYDALDTTEINRAPEERTQWRTIQHGERLRLMIALE